MPSFSQRIGVQPLKKQIQYESLDEITRNRLFNALVTYYFRYPIIGGEYKGDMYELLHVLWHDYFKQRTTLFRSDSETWKRFLLENFWKWEWWYVCDFLEFIVQNYRVFTVNAAFRAQCNEIFEEESFPHKFVGSEIIPLTNEEEVSEIEKALISPIDPIHLHFEKTINFFADRNKPDYQNSIKESISAVECICQIIAEDRTASLGKALKRLQGKGVELNPVLFEGLQKLYGYTNTEDGIRHAMMELDKVDQDDARFMLVTCSAFVNYLIAEAGKAGLDLQANYEAIRKS